MQVCLAHDYVVPYDNVPIGSKTWEELDITWPNPFNPKVPNSAQLLRPIAYAHRYHLVSGKQAYLNLAEFGVPRAKITVIHIKPLKKMQAYRLLHDKQPVIGIYIHQTTDVRTYRFKDRYGHISTIHATSNHPFYVASLRTYLPISQITNTMVLEGKQQQSVYLVCFNHKYHHCGIPYRSKTVNTVYNLEVYRRHLFRVSNALIKVHNSDTAPVNISLQDQLNTMYNHRYSNTRRSSDPIARLKTQMTKDLMRGNNLVVIKRGQPAYYEGRYMKGDRRVVYSMYNIWKDERLYSAHQGTFVGEVNYILNDRSLLPVQAGDRYPITFIINLDESSITTVGLMYITRQSNIEGESIPVIFKNKQSISIEGDNLINENGYSTIIPYDPRYIAGDPASIYAAENF